MNIFVVIIFYGLMAILGLGLAWAFDLSVWTRGDDVVLWRALGIGVAIGVATVGVSQLITMWTQWGKRLDEGLRELIGAQSVPVCVVMALCSSVGEELLFRGFLQQVLEFHVFDSWFGPQTATILAVLVSGVGFGLMHIGPDREKFLPWTIMAVVMGCVFGWSFVSTGSLLAPITAHFVINAINLTLMTRPSEDLGDQ